MYCPKCGTNLPDDASFCGNCGNRIDAKPSPAPSPAPAAPTGFGSNAVNTFGATPKKQINGMSITAVVLAAIAMLTTLMPWFETSSMLANVSSQAAGLVSGASSLFGGSSSAGSSLKFEDSYALYSLFGFSDTYKEYADIYGSAASLLGGSSSSLKTTSSMLGIFAWGMLIFWLAALGYTIWGAAQLISKGNLSALRIGNGLLMGLATCFYVFTLYVGSSAGSSTIFPLICILFSAASLVCLSVAKTKAGV